MGLKAEQRDEAVFLSNQIVAIINGRNLDVAETALAAALLQCELSRGEPRSLYRLPEMLHRILHVGVTTAAASAAPSSPALDTSVPEAEAATPDAPADRGAEDPAPDSGAEEPAAAPAQEEPLAKPERKRRPVGRKARR